MCSLSGNLPLILALSWHDTAATPLQTADWLAQQPAIVCFPLNCCVSPAPGRFCWKAAGSSSLSVTTDGYADWLVPASRSHAPPLHRSPACAALVAVSAEGLCALGLWSCGQEERISVTARRAEEEKSRCSLVSFHSSFWGIRLNREIAAEKRAETSLWHLTGRPSIPNSMRCSYGRQG